MWTLGRFPVIAPAATTQSGTFDSGALVLAGNNVVTETQSGAFSAGNVVLAGQAPTATIVVAFATAGLVLGGQLTDSYGGPALLDVTSANLALGANDMLRVQLGIISPAALVLQGQTVGIGSVIPRDDHGDPLESWVTTLDTGESRAEGEDDGVSSTVMVGPSGISYAYGKDDGESWGSS